MNVQKHQRKQRPRTVGQDLQRQWTLWEPTDHGELEHVEGGRVIATTANVTLNSELLKTIQRIWAKDVLEALGPGVIDPVGPVADISNGF